MKKLQNNFTTHEQSKRLLELGVPEWTADCYFRLDLYSSKTEMCFTKGDSLLHHYTPCWSVGRLIELYMKAKGLDFMYFRIMSDANMIDSIIRMFVENQNEIDFLKLDE